MYFEEMFLNKFQKKSVKNTISFFFFFFIETERSKNLLNFLYWL